MIVTASLVLAIVMQISCSRHTEMITGTAEDAQIIETMQVVSSVPPAINPNTTPGLLGGLLDTLGGIVGEVTEGVGDLADTIITTVLPPCGVDSNIVSRLLGGIVYVSCGQAQMGELQIGPNALPADTVVKIESYSLEVIGLPVREYHFSPDGLKFNSTVTLKLSGDLFMDQHGTIPPAILWVYYNPRTAAWELQNEIPIANDGFFYIPISHFSIYRAITRNGIGISQGGQAQNNQN